EKPDQFRKSHVFDYKGGVAFCHQGKPGIGAVSIPNQVNIEPRTSHLIYKNVADVNAKAQPSWILFDRQVLRFYAYFQESVNERRDEQFRIRKCQILFYLEDDSIYVSEPRELNSGIPQGALIARHRIPIPGQSNSQHYTLGDLNVNKTVVFYGKTFKIIGCDAFTRDFLRKCKIDVPENCHYPRDSYQELRHELTSRMKAVHSRETNFGLKKFLEHDRHVLRFYCLWDDTLSKFGETRKMLINYFLADDTFEIFEDVEQNSGRDKRNNTFLRRGKLPKNPELYSPDASSKDPNDYYTDRDLGIGAIISVYGRPFILCDCDAFTRNYYLEQYCVTLNDPITFEDDDNAELLQAMTQRTYPPYNGFGLEDDSLGSCISLIPKPPHKDFKRLMAYDRIVLRFEAKLKSKRMVDKDRRFVICFYVADESVQVFEPHQRNTGILGGKFLERTKLKKENGDAYTCKDFYLGAEINCFGHHFVLEKADEYALNYMQQNHKEFTQSNLNEILAKIKSPELKKTIKPDLVPLEQFEEQFSKLLPSLTLHERQLVIRLLKIDNATVDTKRLLEALE
ncbi:hypothetical protein ROZALSC1DRAFT_27403, partial [Rozella allomycis CSF55]